MDSFLTKECCGGVYITELPLVASNYNCILLPSSEYASILPLFELLLAVYFVLH